MSENKTKVILHAEIEGIDITIIVFSINAADMASDMMLKIIDKIDAWDVKRLAESIEKDK